MGSVFEGAEHGCTIIVREIELARRAGKEIMVYYPRYLGTQRLGFCWVPDVLLLSISPARGRFDGGDGELDVIECLDVGVCDICGRGYLIAAPCITVRDIFAHDIDVVRCDKASAILIFDRGRTASPSWGESAISCRNTPESLEVVDHPEVKLDVLGVVGDVGQVVEEVLE